MSDLLFTAQYHVGNAYAATRTFARRLRQDAGQTAAEYMGVLLVVSVIIAAVSQTGIGGEIKSKMTHIVRIVAVGKTDVHNKGAADSNESQDANGGG
jgi:Flp pilus assembly pilin Flp